MIRNFVSKRTLLPLQVDAEPTVQHDPGRLDDPCTVLGQAVVSQAGVEGVAVDCEVNEATRRLRVLGRSALVGLVLLPESGEALSQPSFLVLEAASSGALRSFTAREAVAWFDRQSTSSDRHILRSAREVSERARLRSRRATLPSA